MPKAESMIAQTDKSENNELLLDIRHCSRCGGDHLQLLFNVFTRRHSSFKYSHWAMCPEMQEPIMMYIVPEE